MAFLALCCFSSEDPSASGSDGLRPSGDGSDDDDDDDDDDDNDEASSRLIGYKVTNPPFNVLGEKEEEIDVGS